MKKYSKEWCALKIVELETRLNCLETRLKMKGDKQDG